MDDDIFKIVGGGIFGLIGLIMLSVGGFLTWKQVNVLKTWPDVAATVAGSKVTHYLSDRVMYTAEIDFRYVVSGREYVSPGPADYSSSSYGEMRRKADAYPIGSKHVIKYNPKDPNDIRHTAGYTFGFFFLPLIFDGLGLILTGIGLPLLVIWIRGRRSVAVPFPAIR